MDATIIKSQNLRVKFVVMFVVVLGCVVDTATGKEIKKNKLLLICLAIIVNEKGTSISCSQLCGTSLGMVHSCSNKTHKDRDE